MLLKIDLQEIPKIKPSSLHLRHLSCRPHHVTNTTALFEVPFEGCGTTQGTKDRYIEFSNAVENSLSLNESRWMMVRHVPEFHFPFMCYYRPKYLITVQEGEGHGTGNDSGKQPKVEGETFSIIWICSAAKIIITSLILQAINRWSMHFARRIILWDSKTTLFFARICC